MKFVTLFSCLHLPRSNKKKEIEFVTCCMYFDINFNTNKNRLLWKIIKMLILNPLERRNSSVAFFKINNWISPKFRKQSAFKTYTDNQDFH